MSLIFKLQKKKILRILIKVFVFLSGTALLIVQIHGTIGTFIKKRTSTGFAISKKISKSIIPPTIIFCPKHKWTFMHENISNLSIAVSISFPDHLFNLLFTEHHTKCRHHRAELIARNVSFKREFCFM